MTINKANIFIGYRKLIVFAVACFLVFFSKITDKIWLGVAIIFVGGNLLDRCLDLVELWLKRGKNEGA